jgi:Mce-associated membrane protein
MTMLARLKRDKAAREAATDPENPATEAGLDADEIDVEEVEEADEADEVEYEEADESDEAAAEPAKIVKVRKKSAEFVEVESPEVGAASGGSRRGAVLVLAVLSVVTLALTAAVVLLWSWKGDLNAKENAAQDGLNAAISAAQDFSSYDYRTLDSNTKTSANAATGAFRQQYLQLMRTVGQSAQQQQVVVVGTVLKAGVEQVGAEQLVAVVFLNQDTTRLNQPRGTDQYRLRLTLDKVKGRWLVSKFQAL